MPAPAKLPNSHSLFPAHRDLASSLLADGGFSLLWWATPSPGTHSLCPGFASKPQALTTKSVLLSGGLTSDVRSHPAKPRTQRTCPAHFSAVEGLWLAATNSMSFPPALAPYEWPPWFLLDSGPNGESTGRSSWLVWVPSIRPDASRLRQSS